MSERWRRLLRVWADPEREVDDEIGFHLEMRARELERRGLSADEARREAARFFGDREGIERELRDLAEGRRRRAHHSNFLADVGLDLRYALRAMTSRPAVPVVIVVMLALGIGAGTAVFGLFRAVVLEPVPVPHADELLVLTEGAGEGGGSPISFPMLSALRASARTATVAGVATTNVAVHLDGRAEQVRAGLVTGDYFDVLGLGAHRGRLLGASDEGAPGASPYAVIGQGAWRRWFGGSADAIGARIEINGHVFTVVGIAQAGFRGIDLADPQDVWLPLPMAGTIDNGGLFSMGNALEVWSLQWITGIARPAQGVSPERAVTELSSVHAHATAEHAPDDASPFGPREPATLLATPFRIAAAAESRAELLQLLRVLAAVVAVALLLACVNVTNLLMMRARQRGSELAIRGALGARTGRIVRQLVVENAVLGVAASALGVLVTLAALRILAAFTLPGRIAVAELRLGVGGYVLLFALATTFVCVLSCGVLPAIAAGRTHPAATLRGQAHGGRSRGWRGGPALVAAQVALTIVLLVSGALFLRSLQEALRVDLGFEPDGVAAVSVALQQNGYGTDQLDGFVREVLEAFDASGVSNASAATHVPIAARALRFPIAADPSSADRTSLAINTIAPGYFEVLRIPLVAGREFGLADREGAPAVAILTAETAAALWPGEDPLGRTLSVLPPVGPTATVVGIVPDGHYQSLTERTPFVYLPLAQASNLGAMTRLELLARSGDAAAARSRLETAVRVVDPTLPTFDRRALAHQLDDVLMPQRFGTMLLVVFGGVGLLISGIGIYAAAAFEATRRRRELGIRAALGARGTDQVRVVLTSSGAAIAAGLVIGLVLAFVAARLIRGFLFGIPPDEPVAYVAGTLLLAAVAALASWIPARRAAGADPLEVIRES